MDDDLVVRARDGDHAAFEALVVAVADRLMAIAFGIMRDRELAEDVVQATIVAAWHDLDRLRDPGRFEAWIRRILVHACYTMHGARRRERSAVQRLRITTAGPDLIGGVVDRDALERAFRHLSIEHRAVLVYRFYLDLPVERIADELGLPSGTVKSRLHFATKAMRAAMDADARRNETAEVPA